MADSVAPCVDRWLDENEVECGTTSWKEARMEVTSPNPSYDERYSNGQNETKLAYKWLSIRLYARPEENRDFLKASSASWYELII